MLASLGLILLGLLWMALAVGAGRTLLRALGLQFLGRADATLFSLAAGYTFTSYYLFGIGTLFGLGSAVIWVVALTLAAMGAVGLWRWPSQLARRLPSSLADLSLPKYAQDGAWTAGSVTRMLRAHWAVTLLLALLIAHALLNLVAALAPPTEADSLFHHLAAPKYFLTEGRIYFKPYENWPIPATAETWNLLGLMSGSDRLSQLFVYMMGLAGVGALYLLARRRMSVKVALLAGAVYYTLPDVTILTSGAKSDLVMLFFVVLSLHSLLLWRETRDLRWLGLSGFLTGMAAATKIQGLFRVVTMAVVMPLVVVWDSRGKWRPASRWLVVFGALGTMAVAPWYVRNWIDGGDPIWPYGYEVFESRYWSQKKHDKYSSWTQGRGSDLLTYPIGLWDLTNRTDIYGDQGWKFPKSPVTLAFVVPLPLAMIGGSRRSKSLIILALAAFVVMYTSWYFTLQQPRYILPGFALLAPVAAYVYFRLLKLPVARWIGTLVIVVSFGLMLGYNIVYNSKFFGVVSGYEERVQFLEDRVIFYRDIEWANTNLPADSRPYVVLHFIKPYYFDHLYMLREELDPHANPIDGPDDFLARLRAAGATHVFYPSLPPETSSPEGDPLVGPLIVSGNLRPIYTNTMARIVESRTLGDFRTAQVDIYAIVYPSLQ